MQVLHVSYSDQSGGAAKAAFRIHQALLENQVDSWMLVVEKYSNCPKVIQISNWSRLRVKINNKFASLLLLFQHSNNSGHHSLGLFTSGLGKQINFLDSEIVNLHWVGNEMLGSKEIGNIKQPLVWTLHDMWPFRGCEHYSHINHAGEQSYDLATGFPWNRASYTKKLATAKKLGIHYVCPSRWMSMQLLKTPFATSLQASTIANCVDEKLFRSAPKAEARTVLDLPQDVTLILFGAIAAEDDSRKGFGMLIGALRLLSKDPLAQGRSIQLVVFGGSTNCSNADQVEGIPIVRLGLLNNESCIAAAYQACDLFVAPSLQENLANTVNEALACGTPSVAFDIGGMPDLINKENGVLASELSAEGLKEAITIALNKDDWDFSSNSSRSYKAVANRYQTLYKQLHNKRRQAIR